jgi:tetratricopeptide (TPR) repeat protein
VLMDFRFLAIRRALTKRSLVNLSGTETNPVFSMHRSLQHAILLQLDRDPTLRKDRFDQAFKAIRVITPYPSSKQIPDPKLWPQFELAIPHIVSMCHKHMKSQPAMKGSLELAELLYDGGFFLWEREDPATEDGKLVLESALNMLDEEGYSQNGKLRADVLAVHAMCCDRIGPSHYAEGLEKRKLARQIRQATKEKEIADDNVTDTTDRLLYNSLNDQGISELQLNNFDAAERLFVECLKKYQSWGSEADIPFEYAKYNHNMATVRMYQGKFDEAIQLGKHGVDLEGHYEGSRNSRVLWFDYDYACILVQAGDIQAALKKHMKILEGRELQSGKYSEITLQSYYTVGAMYYHLGDLEMAEKFLRECIDRANSIGRKRWPECALGRAHLHLSIVMKHLSRSSDAIEEHEKLAKRILDHYRHIDLLESITGMGGKVNDMILYDAIQPVFDGRFTGRDFLPLLQQIQMGTQLSTKNRIGALTWA